MDREQAFARFDELGDAAVQKLALAWNQPMQGYAFEWLKLRADESRSRTDALNARSERHARTAATAAVVAAVAAVIAIPIAIIAIVVSYLAWRHPG